MMDITPVKGSVEASSYNAFDADIFEPPRQLLLFPSAGLVNNLAGMQL